VAPKGPKKDTTRGDDLAASILRTSKVVEAAWAYARYWASEEGQLLPERPSHVKHSWAQEPQKRQEPEVLSSVRGAREKDHRPG
jgi:hypothetical protein